MKGTSHRDASLRIYIWPNNQKFMAVRQCPNGTGSHLRSVHRLRQVQCGRGAHEWNTRTFWPAPAKNVRAQAPRRKRSLRATGAESGFESRPRSPKSESDSQWCPALSDRDGSRLATPPAARAARKIRSHWQGAGTSIPDPRVVPDLPRRERGPRPGRPGLADSDSEMAGGPGGSGPCAQCTSGLQRCAQGPAGAVYGTQGHRICRSP